MRPDLRHLLLAAALAGGLAHAQLVPIDPDWKEADAPAPPATVRTQGLVPVDVSGSQLQWGVDPASVSIGADGIVRYVVVAAGEGAALNALYEGLRCSTGEVKVYARRSAPGAWVPAKADWRPVINNGAARHSLAIARNGACTGSAPNVSAAQMNRDLAANNKGRHADNWR